MESYPSLETFTDRYSHVLEMDSPVLRVFGYGSILWKPGCDYDAYMIGHIEGFVRKFNQGNETFRGTKQKPGRVANLEAKKGAKQWGIAFEFRGKQKVREALGHFYEREIAGGDYTVIETDFHPRSADSLYHHTALPHPPSSSNSLQTTATSSAPSLSSSSSSSSSTSSSTSSSSLSSSTSSSLVPSTQHSELQPSSKVTQTDRIASKLSVPLSTEPLNTPQPGSNPVQTVSVNNPPTSRRYTSSLPSNKHRHRNQHKQNHSNESPRSVSRRNKDTIKERCNDFSTNNSNKRTSKDKDFQNELDSQHITSTCSRKVRQPLGRIDTNVFVDALQKPTERYPHPPKSKGIFNENTSENTTISVLVFTVLTDNRLYLGPDDLDKMADQIVSTSGTSGKNSEYVLKTAEFCEQYIPEDQDPMIFELATMIRQRERQLLNDKAFAISRVSG